MDNNEIFPVDNEDDDVVVTLDLDDGSEVTCEILTIFDVDDMDYIVLLPIEENGKAVDDDSTCFIYRYLEDENGTPTLDNILDDDEYDRVAARFEELQEEAAIYDEED